MNIYLNEGNYDVFCKICEKVNEKGSSYLKSPIVFRDISNYGVFALQDAINIYTALLSKYINGDFILPLEHHRYKVKTGKVTGIYVVANSEIEARKTAINMGYEPISVEKEC